MDFGNLAALLLFYQNIDIFLLVLVRLLAFLLILPVFTGTNIPASIKVGFAFFLAVVIFSNGSFGRITYDENIFGYVILIIKEFLVGFITAFVVYVMFSVFYFIGQLVDFQIGFSMVSVFDPMSQIQVPITGNLFYLLIMLLFIQTGGLDSMIYTISKSYEVLPVGSAFILGNVSIMRYILDIMTNYFVLGIKFAMPIVGTILIVDIALGVLTKAVPQMNVFVVGMPIKLFIGLIVIYLIIPVFGSIYNYIYSDSVRYIMNVIRGMVP